MPGLAVAENHMKPALIPSIALITTIAIAHAHAMTMVDRSPDGPSAPVHLAGNTSSNSSSNTSSDSGSRGSSYVHRHDWSVDSDGRYGRRSVRGSTRIERYTPSRGRAYRHRRDRDDD
jgi:hypothetical protein